MAQDRGQGLWDDGSEPAGNEVSHLACRGSCGPPALSGTSLQHHHEEELTNLVNQIRSVAIQVDISHNNGLVPHLKNEKYLNSLYACPEGYRDLLSMQDE